MEHPEEQNISLEDILREFSDRPQGKTASEPAPVRPDTIRLDEIQEAVASVPSPEGDTVAYAPIEEEPAADEATRPVPTEPFSAQWEPDYEAAEDFSDTARLPKAAPADNSRLRQLRREIVAGPEKRYHDLLEKGLGKLRFTGFVNILLFLAMAAMTLCYHFGVFGPERLRMIVFIQFFGLLLSGLIGSYRLLDGLADAVHLRFTPNTLLVLTFIGCVIDGILCLRQQRIGLSSVFVLEMSMAIWAASQRRATEMAQMDTLRRATEVYSLVRVPDYRDGKSAYLQGQGNISDFMDSYAKPSTPEKILGWYALGVLTAGIAVGITGGVLHGLSTGVQLGVATWMVGLPATAFISMSRPMALLQKVLSKHGSVLCGWKGVTAVEKQAVYPLFDSDLFPAGSVKLGGTKFYNEYAPDEVVAYTTALMKSNGGAVVDVFTRLLDSRNGYIFTVEQFRRLNGGVSGNFGDVSVLVGTRQFMQDMGVDMSKATQLDHGVYTAVDGYLAGVFVLQYARSKSTAAGLRTLCSYKGLTPMVMTEDFLLTARAVADTFRVDPRHMEFPQREDYQPLLERQAEPDDTVVALSTRDNLASRGFAVTGARVLKSSLRAGLVTHMIGGTLGVGVMLTLAIVGMAGLLDPVNVLLFELVWMIPGLLITEWTRSL